MAFDAKLNFSYALIATAPTPAASGTTFSVTAGLGAIFPVAPFNAVVWPAGANPLTTNAEVVRVTNKGTGDNWTVTRVQESSSARSIAIGDQIMLAVTAKTLTDIEAQVTTDGVNIGLAKWNVVTTTSTGTQNDFAPGLSGHTELRCNNATLLSITGFTGGFDGQMVRLVSVGAGQVDLSHQAGGSTIGNRLINLVTTGVTSLAAGSGSALYQYDATTGRWRLVQHEQGAWITRTFAAGNYTATAGNYTVAGATRDAFYLRGRSLSFAVAVSGTTSGTPVSVKVTLPQSYSAAASDIAAAYVSANGAGAGEGGYVQAATTTINFQRFNNVAFAAGTVAVNAVTNFEIT